MPVITANRRNKSLDLSPHKNSVFKKKPNKPLLTKLTVNPTAKPASAPGSNGRAKLTAEAVESIRANRASKNPTTIRELAELHGVAIPTITHCLYGITWKSKKSKSSKS